jgi:hypothetical protein
LKFKLLTSKSNIGKEQPIVPLHLGPPFFLTILFLSTALLTGMTGNSLHVAIASDFSVAWQFSQREQLLFLLWKKLHALI